MKEEELGERLFPEELEKFKLKGPFEEAMEGQPAAPPSLPRFSAATRPQPREAEPKKGDDTELILAKLDAIDARLRVIEEKLKRL